MNRGRKRASGNSRHAARSRLLGRTAFTALALLVGLDVGLLPASSPTTAATSIPASRRSPPAEAGRSLKARVDGEARRLLRDMRAAGFSLAVADRGRVVFAEGYGWAHLPRRVPARADTVYRTGSVGKQFAAAALLRLAEQARLSLDDPIGKFLPHYPSALQRITVRQLLSHTAGLRELNGIPEFSRSQGIGMSRAQALELIARQPLEFEPGTNWSYSNSGYLVAGEIIEAVTARPAERFMIDEVVRPQGLRDTSACRRTENSIRWARGYERQDPGGWSRAARLGRPPTLVPARSINLDIVSSAGGFCSTAIDLVRWTNELHRGEVLSPESRRQMVEPATLADGSTVPYSLGLQWRRFGDHRAIGHAGIIWGFNAVVADFPDDGVTVALMINTLVPEEEAKRFWTRLLGAVFNERPGRWEDLYGNPTGRRTPASSLREYGL
jgi:D-alanyl-D-alanine carboxypeptidase